MEQIAKVFKSGNSQAVRLPKEFRFDVDKVSVTREGDAIILRPHSVTHSRWGSLRSALQRGFSDEMETTLNESITQQNRPNLSDLFG